MGNSFSKPDRTSETRTPSTRRWKSWSYWRHLCCLSNKYTQNESTITNTQLEQRISTGQIVNGRESTQSPTNNQVENSGGKENSEVEVSVFASVRYSGDTQRDIWKGLLNEQEVANLITLMQKDKIISLEPIPYGSTRPKRITLESGIVGIFKAQSMDDPWTTSYSSEIAAYQVDKALGLNMVPLTVEREVELEVGNKTITQKGSFQLWVSNLLSETHVCGFPLPNNARFFDLLIAHKDRNVELGRNFGLLVDVPVQAVLFDNASAFNLNNVDPLDSALFTPESVRRFMPGADILEKVRLLNVDEITHLNSEQRASLTERRNMLVEVMKQ